MSIQNTTIKSKQDGLELDIAFIQPQGEIKGIIQISHGMAEHKERYFDFMEYLVSNGYVVVIHDHRGHGKSIKRKEDLGYFYEEKANYIVEDLYQVTCFIQEKYPNQKLILFGHSMGSMVVRKYIKKYDKKISELIVCGSPSKNPFLGMALFLVQILKWLKGEQYRSKLLQNLAFGTYHKKVEKPITKNAWICANEKTVITYEKDELCGYTFTVNGFQNLFILMRDIYSKKGWNIQNKNLPILFIAGEKDPVIGNIKAWKKAQDFIRNLGYTNVSGKLYPNLRHEILNETEKDIVYQDIIQWIEKNN